MDFSASELQLEGSRVTEQEVLIDRVRFDLEMIFHATTDVNSGERVLRGSLNYCTNLWSPQTMLAFLDYYLNLIDRCLRTPSESVQKCSLISEKIGGGLACARTAEAFGDGIDRGDCVQRASEGSTGAWGFDMELSANRG